MPLTRNAAPVPAPKPERNRQLVTTEEHVVEASITRKDGTSNLFTAVVDLGRGKVSITQVTRPTSVDLEGLGDIIEYFNELYVLLENAPAKVTETPEATPAAAASSK